MKYKDIMLKGTEHFLLNGTETDLSVNDFWQWLFFGSDRYKVETGRISCDKGHRLRGTPLIRATGHLIRSITGEEG